MSFDYNQKQKFSISFNYFNPYTKFPITNDTPTKLCDSQVIFHFQTGQRIRLLLTKDGGVRSRLPWYFDVEFGLKCHRVLPCSTVQKVHTCHFMWLSADDVSPATVAPQRKLHSSGEINTHNRCGKIFDKYLSLLIWKLNSDGCKSWFQLNHMSRTSASTREFFACYKHVMYTCIINWETNNYFINNFQT